jgi:hypothetical protein
MPTALIPPTDNATARSSVEEKTSPPKTIRLRISVITTPHHISRINSASVNGFRTALLKPS